MHLLGRRRPSLLGVLALSLALASCGGPRGGAPAQPDGAGAGATTVHVVARDFRFSLDRAEVDAGTVTFVLRNDGASQHDLRISGNGVDRQTAAIDAGGTASLTVDLRPGAYAVGCSVPGHELMGMKGTITVR